ncbi:MAG TPA: hypothetical protein VGJ70_12475, partial [Solirubrobacteraceae bacterium]
MGGVDLSVAAEHRAGELAPIVYLHGFGSTKEDYVDIARHHAFARRPYLAYDAPGSSTSRATSPPRDCF